MREPVLEWPRLKEEGSMTIAGQRKRYREILDGNECVHPASVFDPISGRIAQDLGFRAGMFAGSIASATVLGAPDYVVLTLSEFAGQIRRIMRAADIPLMVDSDHGYGNALNVMRTVEELEHAGVSGMTIEDTQLPPLYGQAGETLISKDEMLGKLRGALAARQDSSMAIFGRTSGIRIVGLEETAQRVKAYAGTGVDGIFLAGLRSTEELHAIRQVTSLPLLLGGSPPSLGTTSDLASNGVRIALQGHMPFQAAVRAVYETLKHLKEGGSPSDLGDKTAPPDMMTQFTRQPDYDASRRDYLAQEV